MASAKCCSSFAIFILSSPSLVLCMVGDEIKKGYWHDYETHPSREETFQLPEGHTYDQFMYNSTEDRILMGGTTADNSFDNIHDTMIPILKSWFGDSLHYVYMRPSHSREKDLDDWGVPQGSQYRPTMVKLFIVSPRFANKTTDDRHAMVHEALRDEMMKREAGCAIDIHADTPEEWNEFRANNDFDEVSGKPDLRARAAKTTPITLKDTKLREKIYKYLKLHFKPTILHVVDSKHMHPVDNDNPAFDVLLVSLHFSNLTITQRTMMMHDYLRDFINEGIQFRLHCLQAPEETWPDRFNEDGVESARLKPVHNLREYMNLYKVYVTAPKHVVELNHRLINNISVIEEAKRQLREHDRKMKQAAAG